MELEFFLLRLSDTLTQFELDGVFMHCISIEELLVTSQTDETSSFLGGVIHRVRTRLLKTGRTIHCPTELAILELLVVLDAVIALGSTEIPLIPANLALQLEYLVVFSIQYEIVLFDLDLLDFLGDRCVLLIQPMSLWVR